MILCLLLVDKPWLNPPFNHLPNNKFTKISMQLSFYSFLFEELTGRGCEKLFIDLITPVFDENHRLLSYKTKQYNCLFKNDIKIFLETFKDEILDELNNTLKCSI